MIIAASSQTSGLARPKPRADAKHWLEPDTQFSPGEEQCQLVRCTPQTGMEVGGSIDFFPEDGVWAALLSCAYDPRTGESSLAVYLGPSRDLAIDALWRNRHKAMYTPLTQEPPLGARVWLN